MNKFVTTILLSMVTEDNIKGLLFKLADRVVKSTKSKHDDKWLIELKELYNKVE